MSQSNKDSDPEDQANDFAPNSLFHKIREDYLKQRRSGETDEAYEPVEPVSRPPLNLPDPDVVPHGEAVLRVQRMQQVVLLLEPLLAGDIPEASSTLQEILDSTPMTTMAAEERSALDGNDHVCPASLLAGAMAGVFYGVLTEVDALSDQHGLVEAAIETFSRSALSAEAAYLTQM